MFDDGSGTEAEALSEWDDGDYGFDVDDADDTRLISVPLDRRRTRRERESHESGGDRTQPDRWRCTTTGCNPVLFGEDAATAHREESGHRTAKWPVRSAEGKRRARARNRTGYYDRYNVGAKGPRVRFF